METGLIKFTMAGSQEWTDDLNKFGVNYDYTKKESPNNQERITDCATKHLSLGKLFLTLAVLEGTFTENQRNKVGHELPWYSGKQT